MDEIHLRYINGPDIEALNITDTEILDAIESGPARPGQSRDRDRTTCAPDSRSRIQRPLQRSAWLYRTHAARGHQNSTGIMSRTTNAACLPNSPC